MKQNSFVSIIIPYAIWNDEIQSCLNSCLEQDYPLFEIICLPDVRTYEPELNAVIVHETGPIFPGAKRNRGFQLSSGAIIAFIDSDATADKEWLRNACTIFDSEKEIGIIGGPNLPPETLSNLERASWEILASPLLSGPLSKRYRCAPAHDRLEVQSSNMFIRRELFEQFFFREDILTGEDTMLCFQVFDARWRIRYDPAVAVRHRTRALYFPHMKQFYQYARDQAGVLNILPFQHTILWYTPSLLILLFISGIVLSIIGSSALLMTMLGVGLLWTVTGAFFAGDMSRFVLRWTGSIVTYCTYGTGFIIGLAQKKRSSGFLISGKFF